MALQRTDVLRALAGFHRVRGVEFGLVRIGVFGSFARDQFTDQSDFDVVVELLRPDLLLLVGIKQELEQLLDRPVDVVRYRPSRNPCLTRQSGSRYGISHFGDACLVWKDSTG